MRNFVFAESSRAGRDGPISKQQTQETDQSGQSIMIFSSRFDSLCQAERGWAFERVVGGLLEGFNHKGGNMEQL